MAAAFGAVGAAGTADSGALTQDSASLTVSGTDKVLYVAVGNSDGSPAAPTGVRWDPTGANQAMTQIGTTISIGSFGRFSLWRLIAPTNATAVARATWGANQGERVVNATVVTGTDQTTANGTVAQASATSGTAMSAGAVTTTAGKLVLAFGYTLDIDLNNRLMNSPTGTERSEVTTSPDAYDRVASQDQTAAGASTTPTWTLSGAVNGGWAMYAFQLNDAAGGGGATQPPRSMHQHRMRRH